MKTRSILVILMLPLGLVSSADVSAERVGGSKADQDLEIVLDYLESQGISTKNDDLIRATAPGNPPTVRTFAIEVLGSRRVKKSAPALVKVLEDSGEEIDLRQTAAVALARLGNSQGKERLRGFYEQEANLRRRVYLAGRLAEVGDPVGYEAIEEALKSGSEGVRHVAVISLAEFVRLGSALRTAAPSPSERLLALTADPSEEVRDSAILRIGILAGEGLSLPGVCEQLRARVEGETVEKLRDRAASLASQVCDEPKDNR